MPVCRGTTFWGEVAPEKCSRFTNFKYFLIWVFSKYQKLYRGYRFPLEWRWFCSTHDWQGVVDTSVALRNFTERAPHMKSCFCKPDVLLNCPSDFFVAWHFLQCLFFFHKKLNGLWIFVERRPRRRKPEVIWGESRLRNPSLHLESCPKKWSHAKPGFL